MNAPAIPMLDDEVYAGFLERVQARFLSNVGQGAPLFTTGAADLYTAFLEALPAHERQPNACSACRTFVTRFGGLVTIAEDGSTRSALWHEDDAPAVYQGAVRALRARVEAAEVDGVFYSVVPVWGSPATGRWRHLAVTPPAAALYRGLTQTAGQAHAERLEDFRTLERALGEYSTEMLTTAVSVLRSEALYRSEKVLGVAEWLLALHRARAATKNTRWRAAITWRAVATAPAGYCHPRTSMIGTLLDDIAAGLPFQQVSERFAAKMHPLRYQRPQAAPGAGNIAQAEKLIAQLQAGGALSRRFARLEDIETLWRAEQPPAPEAPRTASGVFGHVRPRSAPAAPAGQLTPPPASLTWEKFLRTVLPTAETIAYFAPAARAHYAALVTAADPQAPQILQWGNPVSWYVYSGGSEPADWGLEPDRFHPVTAVALQPSMWGERPLAHQGASVFFILDGARDLRYQTAGAGLFPEFLRSELHAVRATIEAYSRGAVLAGAEESSACGLRLQQGIAWGAPRFRVVADGIAAEYQLDRWD